MRSKIDSLASFASEDSDSAQEPSSKKIKLDEECDLLSDYKTAVVSPNMSDTRTSRTGTVPVTASDRHYHAAVLAGAKQ